MKIFIDTEFYEHQPWLSPGTNAVQLISLGAVREDGAKFYAENAHFDWNNVPKTHWLQAHVRPVLQVAKPKPPEGTSFLAVLAAEPRLLPKRIATEFRRFAMGENPYPSKDPAGAGDPEFWGYYSDYDWVALCGLYGSMSELPAEFPMLCLDLKQEVHRLGIKRHELPERESGFAHHALDDARWIRDAYNFVQRRQDEEVL